MDSRYRYSIGLSLLAVSLVAVSSVPTERPPAFLTKWGKGCNTDTSGVDGCDGQFSSPIGVATDDSSNVYVAGSGNDRVQKFDSVGNFLTKWGTFGTGDGQFNSPSGVAIDTTGSVFVAEWNNHRIQKFGGPWLDFFIGEPELPSGH